MAGKRADVWLRRKNGKDGKSRADSWYFRKLRLRTTDAATARARARLSREGKWPPPEESAAAVSAAAFTFDPPAATAVPPPPPASSPPPEPAAAPAPPVGDWTDAAAAASTEANTTGQEAPPVEPEQISSEQAADLVVTLQLKGSEVYIQQKYFEAFIAPPIAPEGRAILVNSYRKIFDYAGAAVKLPPWVHGVVVPALTVVISSAAIVAGFRDIALEQKRAAERASGGGA